MTCVGTVVVVGGGIAGLTAATFLARAGVAVDLVEQHPEISALGSGITLQGNALRVLRDLGVWHEVCTVGRPYDHLGFRDAATGEPITEVVSHRIGGDDLPATLGMYRPELARILAANAERAGVRFRFGSPVTAIEQDEACATVSLASGETVTADLVIGADGLRSRVRELLGITDRPTPLNQGIWRAFVARPPAVEYTEIYWGGACYYAGYTPTGEREMYAYLVEEWQDRSALSDAEKVTRMQELAAQYGGPWAEIAAGMDEHTHVNYTGIDRLLVEGEWHRGRAVIIGDAAHSCPPTIAQGAAAAFEDAAVLSQLLLTSDRLDQVWEPFHTRRIPRVSAVVDASVQMSQWQREGASPSLGSELTARISALLAQLP